MIHNKTRVVHGLVGKGIEVLFINLMELVIEKSL
jgi:hypothetical protein